MTYLNSVTVALSSLFDIWYVVVIMCLLAGLCDWLIKRRKDR